VKLLQFAGDARTIHSFHLTLVPGLLQIPAYSEKILELWPELSDEQKAIRLEFRTRLREHVFNRPDPPRCVFIIDESVVSREVGGREVMLDQLRDLVRVGRDSRFEIRVLPLAPFAVLTLESPFVLLDMGDDDTVLYQESTVDDQLMDSDPKKVAEYQGIVQQMLEKSLSVQASRHLIEAKVAALLSALDRA
jgi:hypothetical protein